MSDNEQFGELRFTRSKLYLPSSDLPTNQQNLHDVTSTRYLGPVFPQQITLPLI